MSIGNPGFDSLQMLLAQKGQPIPIQTGMPFDANRADQSYMDMLVNKENLDQSRKAANYSKTTGAINTGVSLLSLLAMLYGGGGGGSALGGLFGGGSSSAAGIANAGAQMGGAYGKLKYGSGGGGLFG